VPAVFVGCGYKCLDVQQVENHGFGQIRPTAPPNRFLFRGFGQMNNTRLVLAVRMICFLFSYVKNS
jgi:hypothetical protein